MSRVASGAAVLLVLSLSGYAVSGCFGPSEWTEPNVSFVVLEVSRDTGMCADATWERGPSERCHEAHLRVQNEMREETLDLEPSDWSAATSRGALYDALRLAGPDRIAPGGSAEVRMLFVLESGQSVAEIRFSDLFSNKPTVAPAPAY